ncbi:sugar-transfer associated ATP-grasp domain-containing protein [Adlercreutzia sp. ZJ141]|uniref:sugar-transfer associated ATP-grasp domain-containing protein n=1 Tax=Adlercreutzia sp. ZJ141 TaxID=2709406 RepID=UPI0013E9B002|nr:sugar-transfer associated ATP-grasp domain-containing protein [Adlercreutzia sp. ZJ141]
MYDKNTLSALLADGFTERMAAEFLEMKEAEIASGMFDPTYLSWAHENGFFAESACAYGLSAENIGDYLSDYDYWKLWPLNDWQRIWINDKLTLNAMLLGTDMQHYLPEYYYYTTPRGFLPLQDSKGVADVSGLIAILKEKGEVAAKPCNGTLACGFHKLEFVDGAFIFDGKTVSEDELVRSLQEMKNYVFTEFLHPAKPLAKISPRIHTIRAIVLNESGVNPELVAAYIRFAVGGDEDGHKPNYVPPTNSNIFSYNAKINLDTGHISNGTIVYANKVINAPQHPTSNALVDLTIDCWSEVVDVMKRMSMKFGACEYLGFDIGITDKGPKIMEINSNSGIKYIQVFQPLLTDERTASYYKSRIAEINALTAEQKAHRNNIWH